MYTYILGLSQKKKIKIEFVQSSWYSYGFQKQAFTLDSKTSSHMGFSKDSYLRFKKVYHMGFKKVLKRDSQKVLIWDLKLSSHLRVKGPLSGLRQFLTIQSPLKIMKNIFYFMLNCSLFVLETSTFLSCIFWQKNRLIRKLWFISKFMTSQTRQQ